MKASKSQDQQAESAGWKPGRADGSVSSPSPKVPGNAVDQSNWHIKFTATASQLKSGRPGVRTQVYLTGEPSAAAATGQRSRALLSQPGRQLPCQL